MKKDKYLRKRGGSAKISDVCCANCNKLLFTYQKDGSGWLKHCYLNRILVPEKWGKLQHDPNIKKSNDMKNLVCGCGSIIGLPMKHKDGRLAFRLERGKFKRKINKKYK